jgi:hypothetical protein
LLSAGSDAQRQEGQHKPVELRRLGERGGTPVAATPTS